MTRFSAFLVLLAQIDCWLKLTEILKMMQRKNFLTMRKTVKVPVFDILQMTAINNIYK